MGTTSTGRGIVAGIDGSDSALGAARWAASIAHRLGEPLHLTHVVPERPSSNGTATATDGEAALDAAEAAVRAAQPEVVVERHIEVGKPAQTLVELSNTARMIVLGHTTTSELQSMFARSDVVHTANHARCPVVSWRGEPGPSELDGQPIVVGVDRSSLSTNAIDHAFEIADKVGAPLTAVHTWTEQSTLTYGEGSRFTDWEAYQQHRTAELAESLAGHREKHPDVDISYSVERGKPDVLLLEHSAHAQLVVVGSHGRSTIASALIGSTSQNLIHHSMCPVLICRS